jgi:hypothetical protein
MSQRQNRGGAIFFHPWGSLGASARARSSFRRACLAEQMAGESTAEAEAEIYQTEDRAAAG